MTLAMVPVPGVGDLVTLGCPCVSYVPLLLGLLPVIAAPEGVGAVFLTIDLSCVPYRSKGLASCLVLFSLLVSRSHRGPEGLSPDLVRTENIFPRQRGELDTFAPVILTNCLAREEIENFPRGFLVRKLESFD